MNDDITSLEWKRDPFIAMFALTGTFLGHRAQSAPPPPPFCPRFLLHHFGAEPSGMTQAVRGGEGEEDMEEQERGEGLVNSQGKGRNFPEIPPHAESS